MLEVKVCHVPSECEKEGCLVSVGCILGSCFHINKGLSAGKKTLRFCCELVIRLRLLGRLIDGWSVLGC